MSNWLTLNDYSNKYHVSISTLRRRIKADEIKYVLEDGKYFLTDEPVTKNHRPSQVNASARQPMMATKASSQTNVTSKAPEGFTRSFQGNPQSSYQPVTLKNADELQAYIQSAQQQSPATSSTQDEPVITAANRLLSELKKAYTQILQEKEEQILHLKEEVSDLKTLVRVLESENERLRN